MHLRRRVSRMLRVLLEVLRWIQSVASFVSFILSALCPALAKFNIFALRRQTVCWGLREGLVVLMGSFVANASLGGLEDVQRYQVVVAL